MQNQSNIRLVDTHAECACRGDHAQMTGSKPLLHIAFRIWREARMEVFRLKSRSPEKLGDAFSCVPRGAVDDCARPAIGRQSAGSDVCNILQLPIPARRAHLEVEVRSKRTAVDAARFSQWAWSMNSVTSPSGVWLFSTVPVRS